MTRHRTIFHTALFCSVAPVVMIMAATSAAAQGTATPAEAEATNDDIVVTARNRKEKLQDVPLSITALSSETLANSNAKKDIW